MLAQELLHTMNKKKTSNQHYLALKLDVENAYDRLEWPFLHLSLKKINFHPWIFYLIMQCVTTTSFTVKVNSEISDVWTPSRGIREGDPLSPFLFILCQDLLTSLLIHNMHNKTITMLKASKDSPPIPLLSFADDCMIFCKASKSFVNTLTRCLTSYVRASGQSICWPKYRIIFSPNVPVHRK